MPKVSHTLGNQFVQIHFGSLGGVRTGCSPESRRGSLRVLRGSAGWTRGRLSGRSCRGREGSWRSGDEQHGAAPALRDGAASSV